MFAIIIPPLSLSLLSIPCGDAERGWCGGRIMFWLLLVTKRFPAPPWLCCHVVFSSYASPLHMCLCSSLHSFVITPLPALWYCPLCWVILTVPPILLILNGSAEIFISLSLSLPIIVSFTLLTVKSQYCHGNILLGPWVSLLINPGLATPSNLPSCSYWSLRVALPLWDL